MNYWLGRKQQIKFGLQMAMTWLVLLYFLFPWAFNYSRPLWAFYISGAFILITIVAPMLLVQIEKFWLRLVAFLGYFKTRIVLGFIYLVLFIPVSLVFKILKRDSLKQQLDPDAESYKIKAEKADLIARMERIF